MPHRTSGHGWTPGKNKVPWLVSTAMWSTCMRFVGNGGITVGELARRARTGTNLAGMQRWGYITVAPDPADNRPKPPPADRVIHATASGPPGTADMAPADRRHRGALGGPVRRGKRRGAPGAAPGAGNVAALREPLQARVPKPAGRVFSCRSCGFSGHRDLAGAANIARRTPAGGPATGSMLPVAITHRRAGRHLPGAGWSRRDPRRRHHHGTAARSPGQPRPAP